MNKINTLIFFFAGLLVFCTQGCVATSNQPSSISQNTPAMIDKKTLTSEVQNLIELAEQAIEQKHWPHANIYLERGLTSLGDLYITQGVIDETGMKLIAADLEEKKGNLENATRVRLKILKTRFELFKAKP